MIAYNKKITWKIQIDNDRKELLKYKESYDNKITLYNFYIASIGIFKGNKIENKGKCIAKEQLTKRIKVLNSQIEKIDISLTMLDEISRNYNGSEKNNIGKNTIYKYNQKCREISRNYLTNSILEEEETMSFIQGLISDFTNLFEKSKLENSKKIEKTIIQMNTNNKKNNTEDNKENMGIENNDTLIISEKEQKVLLPYTAQEIIEFLQDSNNNYETAIDVIENEFVRDFSDYKVQFASRYRETMKLAKEREGYSIADSMLLATEMMGKRMLHPAIISACKTVNELDVYLDCLDKNELDDFKIFKIKFELYPMQVKEKRTEIF